MSIGVALLICISLNVSISNSQLCDSNSYGRNVGHILQETLGDSYTIFSGNLVWIHNFTKWSNNPSGIYGYYAFTYSSGLTTFDGGNPDLFMHSHDAIIYSGCTPPKSHYYSVVNYLFNKYYPNGTIKWPFASLGQSLNNLLINTSGNTPFNQLVNIVHTADNKTFSDIYHVLKTINSNTDNINLLSIPSQYFNFAPYEFDNKNYTKYDHILDSYLGIWRIALPINESEFQQYTSMNQTGVFYLKYKNATINDTKPFVKYDPWTLNTYSPLSLNESIYSKALKKYQDDLVHNITQTYNYTFLHSHSYTFSKKTGFYCINQSIQCVGDNWDDAISYGGKQMTLYSNSCFIALGINSFKLNLTLYQNIDYNIEHNNSIGSSSNIAFSNFDLENTVIDLNIKTNVSVNMLDKLWLIQYAANKSFLSGIIGYNISDQIISENQNITSIQRHYLNPVTRTKPDVDDMIRSHLLEFQAPIL